MQHIRLNIRTDKSKKDDNEFGGHGVYTRAREGKTLKAEDETSPFDLTIYLDPKIVPSNKLQQAVLGVELREQPMPFNPSHPTESKREALKSVYRQGRYAVIQAIRILVAKS